MTDSLAFEYEQVQLDCRRVSDFLGSGDNNGVTVGTYRKGYEVQWKRLALCHNFRPTGFDAYKMDLMIAYRDQRFPVWVRRNLPSMIGKGQRRNHWQIRSVQVNE